MLLKVKTRFLKQKSERIQKENENKENSKTYNSHEDDNSSVRKSQSNHTSRTDKDGKELQEGIITDEDFIELALLDTVLAAKDNKQEVHKRLWEKFIRDIKDEIDGKLKTNSEAGEKKKKILE